MTFGGSAAYSGSRRSRSVRCASRQSRTQSRPGYVRMKCAELASLTLSRTESETSCLVARWFTTSAPCAAKHAGRMAPLLTIRLPFAEVEAAAEVEVGVGAFVPREEGLPRVLERALSGLCYCFSVFFVVPFVSYRPECSVL